MKRKIVKIQERVDLLEVRLRRRKITERRMMVVLWQQKEEMRSG